MIECWISKCSVVHWPEIPNFLSAPSSPCKHLFPLISQHHAWVVLSNTAQKISFSLYIFLSRIKIKTTDFLLFFLPPSAEATSDSSTVRLNQRSAVRTGCHCNHFLPKHTSHYWLPRWDASETFRLWKCRWRVGGRPYQFKPWPGTKSVHWLNFTGLRVAECWLCFHSKL